MKVVTFIGFAALGLGACSHAPKATRYILESGATGWVKITYNRPGAPELPVQNGFAIVNISQDLTISTRSRMNSSWDGAEFYYRMPDKKLVRLSLADNDRRQLWALEKISDNQGDREVFFVGKQDQFTPGIRMKNDLGASLSHSAPSEKPILHVNPMDRLRVETSLPK